MTEVTSVPISIEPDLSDILRGWITIHGVLRVEPDELVLEYRTSTPTMERSEVLQRSISLDNLVRVEYRRGLFGAKLILQARGLAVFDGIPGSQDDRLILSVARGDRPTAKAIGWRLEAALENRKLPRRPGQTPNHT